MYTTKDFNEIAKLLKQVKPIDNAVPANSPYYIGRMHQWETTVDEFATLFEVSNPRFDKERFMRACGNG